MRINYKAFLWIFIVLYIGFFSFFSIKRSQTLYASYYDLGIMHQTVFNTYRAITNADPTRILEMTDTNGPNQIKRMAIHNDIILAPLALFYFINNSPATLLVLQSIILGLGAWAIFEISGEVFKKDRYRNLIGLIFAVSYLLYPGMERANQFDFHAVTIATTSLLFMYYFWLKGKNKWSFLFLVISLLTKEEVALTTTFFGLYIFYENWKNKKSLNYPILAIISSIVWFALSIWVIIPYFRGGDAHFALKYYQEFGDTPGEILIGLLKNPPTLLKHLFSPATWNYLNVVLGPVGFISLLSPLRFIMAIPELAINLLSSQKNLRNIFYHYTSVLEPFIFISAIYGLNNLTTFLTKYKKVKASLWAGTYVLIMAILYAYFFGPLPYAKNAQLHPFKYPSKEAPITKVWADKLTDENLKVSSTGHLAPFFTSRRYFYTFSKYYYLADYIVLRREEIYNYPEHEALIPAYEELVKDPRYQLIYQQDSFQVFKKISP